MDTTTTDKGGRPIGSSRVTINENLSKIEIATEKLAILYQDERIKNVGSLKRGMFKIIHDDVITSMGLGNSIIKYRTILSCLARNSLQVDICNNKTVPLLPIEPLLLQIAHWKQDAE